MQPDRRCRRPVEANDTQKTGTIDMPKPNLTRREFLAASGWMSAPAVLARGGEAQPRSRRNVLFIFSDQQHKFALGCMGNRDVRTPHLDRMAREGVLFRNCYSSNPVCGPYRCSVLTGRYASTTGCWNNGQPLPGDGRNLPEVLERHGIHTSWVGKWHIGGNGNKPIPAELRGGFTDFIGYQCYNGFHQNVCFYDESGQEHRFDRHRTEVTTDLAIERLGKAAAGGKPFVQLVSYQAPHYPVQPLPEYESLYTGKPMKKRPSYQPTEPYTPTFDPPSPKPPGKDPDYQRYGGNMDEYMRLYYGMCSQVDAGVGRILKALDRLGLAGDTLVLFSSDHGDMQGCHGLKNKTLPHEESAGIPCIARVPGGHQGRVCSVPVGSVDVYPTSLVWCGVRLEDAPWAEGRSLAPYLSGRSPLAEEPVFSECNNEGSRWHSVRVGKYKLAARRARESRELKPWLLFDLEKDPYEMSNLVNSESYGPKIQQLMNLLGRFA